MAGSVADGPGIAHAIADIGGRLEMEDEHVLEVGSEGPLRVLGAVFDGHGGSAVARLAARRFPALFRDLSLAMEADPSDWRGYFMASAFVVEAVKAGG